MIQTGGRDGRGGPRPQGGPRVRSRQIPDWVCFSCLKSIIFNSFVEVQLTRNQLHLFKMSTLMNFDMSLCTHEAITLI